MFRARLELALNRIWYGQSRPGPLLRALEKLYATGMRRRRRASRAASATDLAGRPIVVVGNITVGGTGKTPLILRLCELLQGAGYAPGVVARGYGRQGRGLLLLDRDQDVRRSGDEPWLIHERGGVPVAVCAERTRAARALFAQGVDVVLSDDGLQHWHMPRIYEICVVDGRRGFGNGHLLPAGPLREARSRLRQVDAVVVNGPGDAVEGLPRAVTMRMEAREVARLDGTAHMDVGAWRNRIRGRTLVAVAGIGAPERFFELLAELGIEHSPRAFPDHHDYTARDFAGLENALILMTEKDAVKCRQLPLTEAWYMTVDARLPRAWEQSFLDHIGPCIEREGGAE